MADNTPGRLQDVRSVLSWIVGINSLLMLSGIGAVTSVMWGQNTQLAKIAAYQDSTNNRIAELSSQMSTNTASRYTASDAVTDRATTTDTINRMRDSWVAAFTTVQNANNEQEKVINDMLIKLTRLEERTGIK